MDSLEPSEVGATRIEVPGPWTRGHGPLLVVGNAANALQVAASGRLAGCQISHVVCVASTKCANQLRRAFGARLLEQEARQERAFCIAEGSRQEWQPRAKGPQDISFQTFFMNDKLGPRDEVDELTLSGPMNALTNALKAISSRQGMATSSPKSASANGNQASNSWVSARRGVLVHCDDGCNCAPTLALLLLLNYGNCSLREAYVRLLAVRPLSDPLPSYRRMLLHAEAKKLGGKNHSGKVHIDSSHNDEDVDGDYVPSVRPSEVFAVHTSELKVVKGSVVAVPYSAHSSPSELQIPPPSWEMFGIALDSELSLGNDIAAAAEKTAASAVSSTSVLITSSVLPAASVAAETTSWALDTAARGAKALVHAAESAATGAAETMSTTASIATAESEAQPQGRSTPQRAAKSTSPMDYYGIADSDASSNTESEEDNDMNDFNDSTTASNAFGSDNGASEQHLSSIAGTNGSVAWDSYSDLSSFDYMSSGFTFVDEAIIPANAQDKIDTLPSDKKLLLAAREKSISALVSEMGRVTAPALVANQHAHDFLLDSERT